MMIGVVAPEPPAAALADCRFTIIWSRTASGDLQRTASAWRWPSCRALSSARSGRVLPMESVEEARPVHALGTDHRHRLGDRTASRGVGRGQPTGTIGPSPLPLFDRVILDDNGAAGWRSSPGRLHAGSRAARPTPATRPLEAAPGDLLDRRKSDHAELEPLSSVYEGDALAPRDPDFDRPRPPRHALRHAAQPIFQYQLYKLPTATMDNVDPKKTACRRHSLRRRSAVGAILPAKEVALHGAYWHQ